MRLNSDLCIMRYELSPADIDTLRRYQRNVRGKEYIKVTSILMLAKGYSQGKRI
jgi:hypothetical protein